MTLEITEGHIRSRFKALNKEMFGNNLPTPTIKVREYTRVAGLFLGKGKTGTLTISKCFDYDAAALDEVIIHEMIHCRLWHRGRGERSVMAGPSTGNAGASMMCTA